MRRSPALRRLALLLAPSLAAAQPLPLTTPEKVGLDASRLARMRPVLEEEVAKERLPGAVVLVARRGKVAWLERFGRLDPAKPAPMPGDAIFRLASMTKPFTSVLALQYAEEGRLSITDPVSRWLPACKAMRVAVPRTDPGSDRAGWTEVPAAREMTIHDLLRHTSGIGFPGYEGNQAVRESFQAAGLDPMAKEVTTAAQWWERACRTLLAHQPGSTWEYGASTEFLGWILEQVGGKRLSALLEERLFRPLGMEDTGFFVPAGKLGRLAQPYPTDREGKAIQMRDVAAQPEIDFGGAGAVGTAGDYFRFLQALLDGGRLGSARILSRTSVALMTSDHIGARPQVPWVVGEGMGPGIEGYGFGLGFGVRSQAGISGVPGSAGEYFWAGFGGTFFWVDPAEKLIGIYMAQTPGPPETQIRRIVKQLVTQAIID